MYKKINLIHINEYYCDTHNLIELISRMYPDVKLVSIDVTQIMKTENKLKEILFDKYCGNLFFLESCTNPSDICLILNYYQN